MTKKKPPRGRKPMPEDERKARIIQTRVPDDLSDTLQKEAKRMRVTVSQLIRNVLEDTFELVDNVVAETRNLGEIVRRDAKRLAQSAGGVARSAKGGSRAAVERLPSLRPFAEVDAWQEVLVNRDAECAQCGAALTRGKAALLGLVAEGTSRPWLCLSCGSQL